MKHTVKAKQNNSQKCFVCGLDNDFGLKASFFEIDNDELVAIFTPSDLHQGYPGRLHGGLASTILDETIGRAILIKDQNIWGVTLELNVKFRKPIPLNQNLKVVARLTEENSRTFKGTGEIILENGDKAISAEGRYFKLSLDKITDKEFTEDEWFNLPEENDPKEIDF